MSEERGEKAPSIVYTVPPNLDSKTWADIQSKWVDVRLKEIEAEKEKNEIEKEKNRALIELIREVANSLKDYYLKKIPRATIPAYVLIAIIVIGAIALTWLGRVSGETFSFLMGTIVGYIISLLSKYA